MIASDYAALLRSLLPPGAAWSRDARNISDLTKGLGVEFARIDTRALELIEESDPAKTNELIGEWETTAGLPGDCVAPTLLADRQAALLAKLTANSSASLPRINEVAAIAGYPSITIKEYTTPYTCISNCTDELYDEQWVFVWDITAPTGANDALLECLLKDIEPPHTLVRVFFV